MAKIPFTLEEYLAHPELKVETVLKEPVTIVKTDLRCEDGNILCYYFDGKEEIAYVTSGSDLFIITPEPELSEFELKLLDWLSSDTCGEIPMKKMKECVKARASELLDLAKKELVKEGTSKNEMGTMLYDAGFEDGKEEVLRRFNEQRNQ